MQARHYQQVLLAKRPRVLECLPWQNWSVSDGCDTRKIDTDIAPAPAWPGVIGVPGICAWFGLLDITQAALSLIEHGTRIVVCGQTSQCNKGSDDASGKGGTIDPHLLIEHSASVQGFVVHDYDERRGEAIEGLGRLIRDGGLHNRENMYEGIERAPQAFIDLFFGKSFGKRPVRLADDDDGD